MRNFSIFRSLPVMIGLAMILSIFIIKPAKAQHEPKKEKKKTIILKMELDKDGKTTIIDTTFTTSGEFDPEAIRAMAEKMKVEMKGLQKEMQNVQVMVMTDTDDTASTDSVRKCIVIKSGPEGNCRMYSSDRPKCHEYRYEIPFEMGDMPSKEDFEEFHRQFNWVSPDNDFFRSRSHGETISDVIGDIPMDRVRNYSIKNTKYGKKIVIEIED